MRAVFRRLAMVLAVLGGIASVVVAASAGPAGAAAPPRPAAGPVAAPLAPAPCTGPRLVSILGTKAAEGTATDKGGRLTPFTFTVVSEGCALPGEVGFTTVPFTAGADDFVMQTGQLAFRSGDAGRQLITVQVLADPQPEPDECYAVMLLPGSSTVRITTDEAAGIIVDDDQKAKPSRAVTPLVVRAPPVTQEFHCSE
jgi:hypothetical protein